MRCLVTFLNRTSMFNLCVVRQDQREKHHEHTCLNKVDLYTTPYSIVILVLVWYLAR